MDIETDFVSLSSPASSLDFPLQTTQNTVQVNRYSKNKKMQTPPCMTKYEKARILGARALQISMGAPVLIPIEDQTDSLNIAQKEMKAKKIPISIRRTLPDGTIDEYACSDLMLDSESMEDDFTVAIPQTPRGCFSVDERMDDRGSNNNNCMETI